MSAKNLDQKGRHRNKIVAFRVSPEEDALIERAVHLSGLTKQDFIIQLKECKHLIEEAKDLIFTKEPGTAVISNGFAYILHQQEKIEYWLDILCMRDEADKR